MNWNYRMNNFVVIQKGRIHSQIGSIHELFLNLKEICRGYIH